MAQSNGSEFNAAQTVSRSLRVAAAWSWRVIVVCAALTLVALAMAPVKEIVVALLVALLIAALIAPLVSWLRRKFHMADTLAAAIGLVVGVVLVVTLLTVAVDQLVRKLPDMADDAIGGVNQLLDWVNTNLAQGSLQVSDYLQELQDNILDLAQSNSGLLASSVWSFASSAFSVAAAAVIMLFVLFFFLKDGRRMWVWCVRMLPADAREKVHEAGIRGWVTLGAYVRTQVQVAAIDAIGIGVGAAILGVPLVVPIALLVFLCSFVPIVGAFVSGAVAVLLALVNNGVVNALIMLAVVLAVQQLEGNVLQPWLMGQAVSLHPVAVVLAVSVGTILLGIPGALFAVPAIAVANAVILYFHGHDTLPELAEKEDRPGGPPGAIGELVAASYKEEISPAADTPRVRRGRGKTGATGAGDATDQE